MKAKHVCYLSLIFLIASIFSYIPLKGTFASGNKVFLLTEKKGVLVSKNSGSSWKNFNKGLPEDVIPLRIYSSRNKNSSGALFYLATYHSGIFALAGDTWRNISSPDMRLRSRIEKKSRYRKISAFAADAGNPERLYLATKHTLYKSENGGKNWERFPMNGLHARNYITSLAAQGADVYAGTSFNGLFKFSGGRFTASGRGLPKEPYSGTLYYSEELSHLEIGGRNEIYAGHAFGGGLFISRDGGLSWENLKVPSLEKFFYTSDVILRDKKIHAGCGRELFTYDLLKSEWSKISLNTYAENIPSGHHPLGAYVFNEPEGDAGLFFSLDSPSFGKTITLKNTRAIYASIPSVKRNLNGLIATIKKCGFNAVVIDMKDDFGNLYFPTKNKTAQEIYAAKTPVNVAEILRTLKQNGIHAIARMVVFKDEKMFHGYNFAHAILNSSTGRPWQGIKGEYWVDPASRFVQEYHIALAIELEELGFDEIQFDYIRFPSDGPTSLCHFRHLEDPDTYKSEILLDFLRNAKSRLRIPVSADIYGFNSWYHLGNWIGQNMEEFAEVADAVCPMVYPSHFGSIFYRDRGMELHPYIIVYTGGIRALKMAGNAAAIRPYLQAFRMLSPTWGPLYIQNQVRGVGESGLHGFTFWNAKGDYDMVEKALGK